MTGRATPACSHKWYALEVLGPVSRKPKQRVYTSDHELSSKIFRQRRDRPCVPSVFLSCQDPKTILSDSHHPTESLNLPLRFAHPSCTSWPSAEPAPVAVGEGSGNSAGTRVLEIFQKGIMQAFNIIKWKCHLTYVLLRQSVLPRLVQDFLQRALDLQALVCGSCTFQRAGSSCPLT